MATATQNTTPRVEKTHEYREGFAAHRRGESVDACPYEQSTRDDGGYRTQRYAWLYGWYDARETREATR